MDSSNPIFIVGCPRSGTSLLRTILNRHPAIGICDETHFFYYVYSRRTAFGDLQYEQARQRLVKNFTALNCINRIGFDMKSLECNLLNEGKSYRDFFLAIMRTYAVEHNKTRCGEKTPHHALNAETLCDWFPDCTLIHLVRDPRDVVSSLNRMPWGSKNVATNAKSWLQFVQGAERVSQYKNYLLVRYEDLVLQPETTLRRICEFVDEDFMPVMLSAEKEPIEKSIPEEWWFQRAKEPINVSRVGLWRQQLEPDQAALVEWITSDKMNQFGYETGDHSISSPYRTAALLGGAIDSIWRRLSNPGRLWHFWLHPTRIAQEEALIDGRKI